MVPRQGSREESLAENVICVAMAMGFTEEGWGGASVAPSDAGPRWPPCPLKPPSATPRRLRANSGWLAASGRAGGRS